MAAPCLNRKHPDLKKGSYKTQPAPLHPEHEISDPSGHRATVIPQGAGWAMSGFTLPPFSASQNAASSQIAAT